jgi:hypothetical protein
MHPDPPSGYEPESDVGLGLARPTLRSNRRVAPGTPETLT